MNHDDGDIDAQLSRIDPAADLTVREAGLEQAVALLERPSTGAATPRRGVVRRPVLVAGIAGALALTGGVAAATSNGWLFSWDDVTPENAPVALRVDAVVTDGFGVPDGRRGSCDYLVSGFPAALTGLDVEGDGLGEAHPVQESDLDTLDPAIRDEFNAAHEFLAQHDWEAEFADVEIPPLDLIEAEDFEKASGVIPPAVVATLSPEELADIEAAQEEFERANEAGGAVTGPPATEDVVIDQRSWEVVIPRIEQVLADEGLNATGALELTLMLTGCTIEGQE